MRSWARMALAMTVASVGVLSAEDSSLLRLWEGTPPLAVASGKPEAALPLDAGMDPDIMRIGNVTEPTLEMFHPPTGQRSGACVLICPGGGYYIVAYQHEGTQVARWLNSIGVSAGVLKYRVPAPPNEPAHLRPLLDAQRAMALIRRHAGEWGIDPGRVGVLGFSAGGHLAAWLLCEGNRRAQACPAAADEPSARPDFGILVYPAYVGSKDGPPPPLVRAEEKPGPVFFVHADDDRLGSENSLEFYLALKRAGVGAELHVYQQGGHGFGMLPRGLPVHAWPSRCEEWLRAQKLIQSPR